MHTVISKIKLETGTSCHCQWRAEAGSELEETVGPSSSPWLALSPVHILLAQEAASSADVRSAEFCPYRAWKAGCRACGCCSVAQSCLTLCRPMDCSTPGFSVLRHLLELAQTRVIESVMPSSVVPSPPSIFPSIRVFPMSEFFESGGQSTGASASASVLLEMAYHSLMIGAITCPPRDISNLRYRDKKTVCARHRARLKFWLVSCWGQSVNLKCVYSFLRYIM